MPLLEDHIRLGFAHVFDIGGPGWAPLSRKTIYTKVRLGYPLKILIRTGGLRESFTNEGSPYHHCRRTHPAEGHHRAVLFSTHPFFMVHEEGAHFVKRRTAKEGETMGFIPARPMAHMTRTDVIEMAQQAKLAADETLARLSGGT